MNEFTLTTPVALLVFNRPEETAQLFAAIREAQPHQLLVIADGPRSNRPGEWDLCAEVRQIVEQVDWPCQVLRNYSDTNLGCKLRVSSGLDWLFSQVEEAIILEDDCLPDPTFFRFCQEMLCLYRDEARIMSICGSNLLGSWKASLQNYHFSQCYGVWGWATWRRAWKFYDVNMTEWQKPESRRQIYEVLGGGALYRMRAMDFDRVAAGRVDTWDYQWSFAQLMQSGLAAISAVNLISNIGFNAAATHTVNPRTIFARIPTIPCRFPLETNRLIAGDQEFDRAVLKLTQSERPLLLKLADSVRHICGLLLMRKSGQI